MRGLNLPILPTRIEKLEVGKQIGKTTTDYIW